MILTRENLHPKGFVNQGYNRHQIEALGLQYPPKKGWLSALVRTEISDEAYASFVELGGKTFKERRKKKKAGAIAQPPPELFHKKTDPLASGATVFLLDKMPWEKEFTIRIHIPGIHDGSAFASDCEAGKTREEAEALLASVSSALRVPARHDGSASPETYASNLFEESGRDLA